MTQELRGDMDNTTGGVERVHSGSGKGLVVVPKIYYFPSCGRAEYIKILLGM